jgi:hypothetical protein
MNIILLSARIIKVFTSIPRSIIRIYKQIRGIKEINNVPAVAVTYDTVEIKEEKPMNPIRSGLFTTEFLTVVLSYVATILVNAGVLTVNNVNDVVKSAVDIITAVSTIVLSVTYIIGRVQLKKSMLENSLVQGECIEEEVPSENPVVPETPVEPAVTGTPVQN